MKSLVLGKQNQTCYLILLIMFNYVTQFGFGCLMWKKYTEKFTFLFYDNTTKTTLWLVWLIFSKLLIWTSFIMFYVFFTSLVAFFIYVVSYVCLYVCRGKHVVMFCIIKLLSYYTLCTPTISIHMLFINDVSRVA